MLAIEFSFFIQFIFLQQILKLYTFIICIDQRLVLRIVDQKQGLLLQNPCGGPSRNIFQLIKEGAL